LQGNGPLPGYEPDPPACMFALSPGKRFVHFLSIPIGKRRCSGSRFFLARFKSRCGSLPRILNTLTNSTFPNVVVRPTVWSSLISGQECEIHFLDDNQSCIVDLSQKIALADRRLSLEGKANLSIHKHDHFTPTREMRRNVKLLPARNHTRMAMGKKYLAH